MKYYNPATGDDGYSNSDNDPSGAYIFKPKRDDQAKHAYSDFSHVESWTGENSGISILTVYYTDPLKKKLYTCLIHSFEGETYFKTYVNLHGIPILDLKGKEVVVNFTVKDFTNGGTFFTDSNALEM